MPSAMPDLLVLGDVLRFALTWPPIEVTGEDVYPALCHGLDVWQDDMEERLPRGFAFETRDTIRRRDDMTEWRTIGRELTVVSAA